VGHIGEIVAAQQRFFVQGTTLPLAFRRKALINLKQIVLKEQRHILDAIIADCAKPRLEAFTSEIATVLWEIDLALKQLGAWATPATSGNALVNFPSRVRSAAHPYGSVLIAGPWNYPFGLLATPLVSALSAGNCAILKPSEHAPSTTRCIAEIIAKYFDPAHLTVSEGGPVEMRALIGSGIDFIFFTGSTSGGRSVMLEAAQHLIPLTLELGGKNPCIVDRDIPLAVTARRIAWGKFFNAGQTCTAPDYCLVQRDIAHALERALVAAIRSFFGNDPSKSPDYGRIATPVHFKRLTKLFAHETITYGGSIQEHDRYIEPTIVYNPQWESPIMQDEIFGPILPIIPFTMLDEALGCIRRLPSPIAVYCFSKSKEFLSRVERNTRSGNICFNGTLHLMLAKGLPFGGIGPSGMGRYHGKAGFDQFSYQRSIVEKPLRLECALLYPPYRVAVSFLSKLRKVLL
jgi:acyl-CoA reductase-like NAD-dependent aldehyde dehydrogenase